MQVGKTVAAAAAAVTPEGFIEDVGNECMSSGSMEKSGRIGVGDTVRLNEPYSVPDRCGGTYTHGIVAEVITRASVPVQPSARRVSLHLFNPNTRTMDIRPDTAFGERGVPEYIDMTVDELELVHDANESASAVAGDGSNIVSESVPDERALWSSLKPHLAELHSRAKITEPTYLGGRRDEPATVIFSPDEAGEDDEHLAALLSIARRIGWRVVEENEGRETARYTLKTRERERPDK